MSIPAEISNDYFYDYGFMIEPHTRVRSALIWQPGAHAPNRQAISFSLYETPADPREVYSQLVMNPAMLDMPLEPAFLITLQGWEQIHEVFVGHGQLAKSLDLPQHRVAEYLALRHMTRLGGRVRSAEQVADAIRRYQTYEAKLAALNLT
jgi:hypothetical protein